MASLFNSIIEESGPVTEPAPTQSETKLGFRFITDSAEFDDLEIQWEELANNSDSTIFQTFQWNRTWWKHFGTEGQLHLILLLHGEKLVGIAPMFKDTVQLVGSQAYLCLRFLGSNVSQPKRGDLLGLISYTDYLDVIIRPGYENVVCKSLLNHFLTTTVDYDEIILDVVPENSFLWRQLIPLLKQRKIQFHIEDRSGSQMIQLDCKWEEYLMSISKNRRSHARRALKRLYDNEQKIFKVCEVREENQVLPYFETLADLHQRRWNREGSLGAFAEKTNYEFHKEIALRFFRKGWLQMNILMPIENQDENVAIDMNYRYKNRLYGIHCALNVDSEYYNHGPGTVLLNTTLKDVAESQLEYYDFLRGSEEYKLKLSNKTSRNRNIIIRNPRREPRNIIKIVKYYVLTRRRLFREWRQFLLFFTTDSYLKGLMNYIRFFYNKVSVKIKQN